MSDELKIVHAAFQKEIGADTEFCVVYLDDEEAVFELARLTLEPYGIKLHTTTSHKEALELIKKHRNKLVLIISDFNMPVLDGFGFREEVRKIAPTIPFTILSGYVSRENALRGLELKISAFLDKPVEELKLSELLLREGLPRIKSLKEDAELLQGFIGEAQNLIEESEGLLLVLEQEPSDLDSLNKFFGIIHTIKGASSFFEPKTLHVFAHRFEETLKKIQRGEIAPTSDVISALLKGIDIIKEMVGDFQSPDPKSYDVELLVAEIFVLDTPKAEKEEEKVASNRPAAPSSPKQSEIKVPISILDEFMLTSGEMTVIRNMLNKCVRSIEKQYAGDKEIATLVELLEELHKINGDVQVKVTELRKVGLKNILKPLPRAVRDVAGALKKEIQFETKGENLRVDTAIADVLSSCFLHLVKNSIDHGLETPAERIAAGKPSAGKVSISTAIKNEQVLVEVEDDGKGINSDAIKKKLLKNGNHTPEQIAAMSDEEVYSMIFEAGFSTAQQVTDISGRGVGMSMVKDTIVAAGGSIRIISNPGKGTKFLLNLPVPKSVLITDCLFVKCGIDQFGILEEDILRALRIPADQVSEQIQTLEGTKAVLLENEFVPIVELGKLLNLPLEPENKERDFNLIILALPDHGKKLALRVEEILEIEDTVIKNLQFNVNSSGMYRGATFLGDGRLGLILNTSGIFENAYRSQNVKPENRKKPRDETTIQASDSRGILLCELEQPGVYGILQQSIFRVEEIDLSRATFSGGNLLLPYRNQILTILDVSQILFPQPSAPTYSSDEKRSVVIIEHGSHLIGLLFKSVWDVVQVQQMTTDLVNENSGILGHYIYNDKTVTLLDIETIVDRFKVPQRAAA